MKLPGLNIAFILLLTSARVLQSQVPLPVRVNPDIESTGDFSGEEQFVVGILCDTIYSRYETPRGLTPEVLKRSLEAHREIRVVMLDYKMIKSFSKLFLDKMDILVFPYGGIYPMDAYGFYSSEAYNQFLRRGGAILTTGEVPFSKPAGPNGEYLGSSDSLSVDENAYERWISKFGIKYYFSQNPPYRTLANTDYLTALPLTLNVKGCRTGIVVNNSSAVPVPTPSHGNVFPERYPVKNIIPLIYGVDKYNKRLVNNAVLVQDFQTGSRQVFMSFKDEPHPLSTDSPLFYSIVDNLLRLLKNRIMIKSAESRYACYRQGELADFKGEIISFEPGERRITVELKIYSGDLIVYKNLKELLLQQGISQQVAWEWAPGKFLSDEYTFKISVSRDGRLVSEKENGFVVWDDLIARNGPSFSIQNEYFRIGDQTGYITGTNYYESTLGEIMWFRPDVKNIMADLKQMSACGINYIRPHYHHLKWFRDYLLYKYDELFPFYDDLDSVSSPLPDERAWRIFDMFIYLCQKNNIIYGGDLFTLIPQEMGDPRGWFGTTETIYCEKCREVQKEFLRQLSLRYREIPGISWDLFNEPMIPSEDIIEWATDLRTVIKAINPGMLTTVGGADLLGSASDYDAPHGNPSPDSYNSRNKPFLLQEMYLDRKENYSNEVEQAEVLRTYFTITLRNGLAGLCPWSWSRQMRLRQDSWEHHYSFPMEKWDDRLGIHVHDDGTLKLAGKIFRDMSLLMKSLELVDYLPGEKRVVTTSGELVARMDKENESNGNSIYHISGSDCFASMAKERIAWGQRIMLKGIKNSYLYFYTNDDKDFSKSKDLLIKSEEEGKLIVLRNEKPESVSVVEILPSGNEVKERISFRMTEEGLELDVKSYMTGYWIEVLYK